MSSQYPLKSICVYCGSSPGSRPIYTEVAKTLGQTLAQNQLRLVYGGGRVGIMWEIAHAVIEAGGQVTGVIPQGLFDMEVAFTELEDLRIVKDMHERKALMAELSDGFIALPGGLGTLEEFFEALTWAQLDIHKKPCGLLNVDGFYNPLWTFLEHTVSEGFVPPECLDLVLLDDSPEKLVNHMQAYTPPQMDKGAWIHSISKGYREKHDQ